MAIQEYLIFSPAQLAAPGGVTFPTGYASRGIDLSRWEEQMPALMTEMLMGRYIMAVIQVRALKPLPWDATSLNFSGFNPAEDLLLAAYCLSASVGSPYKAGLCSQDWLRNLMAQKQMGIELQNMKMIPRQSTSMYRVFQCTPTGMKLASNGITTLLKFHGNNPNPPLNGAAGATLEDMTRPAQWGWRGGHFPQLLNRPPTRR